MKSQNKGEIPQKNISIFKLYKFATITDKILIIIGIISGLAGGTTFPVFAIIFGNLTSTFSQSGESFKDQLLNKAKNNLLLFLYVGIGTGIVHFIVYSTLTYTSDKQSVVYQKEYFKALLRQDIQWYDKINSFEFSGKIATEISNIRNAIGEKLGSFLLFVSMSVSGFLIAFLRGWQLALIISSALPVIIIGISIFAKIVKSTIMKNTKILNTAGGNVEQALSEIKTVKSLNGEKFETNIYMSEIRSAKSFIIKNGMYIGVGYGILFFSIFLTYALGFYFGSVFIKEKIWNYVLGRDYNVGDVFTIFFCVIMGGQGLGMIGPQIQAIQTGKVSAIGVFDVLEAEPTIKHDEIGKKIAVKEQFQSQIEFKNVQFSYPSKNETAILKDLNLKILPNQKIALVGESGCGKSTIIQLLERFYDADKGQIFIDGINIKDYNLKSLRKLIGYVGQEPVLFSTTIRQNLLYGKDDATDEEIILALKQANAWNFVSKLEKQLDTFVGVGGGQLSGGQKQRIAIARAILKNPPILLLDEATSALDRVNEKIIQNTLDQLSSNRTTITIAHRLTTIQNSDMIFVLDNGVIAEQGTHQQLIQLKGKYFQLVNIQMEKKPEINEQEKSPDEKEIIQYDNAISAQQLFFNQEEVPILELQKKESHKSIEEEQKISKQTQLELQQKQKKQLQKKLLQYNNKEKPYLYLGILMAMIAGSIMPIAGFLLGKIIGILGFPDNPDYRKKVNLYVIMFLVLAIAELIVQSLKKLIFSFISFELSANVREATYSKMLRMPMKWFDEPKNAPGTLSAKLAVDAELVNGLSSQFYALIAEILGAFICGFAIAFSFSWRMTLVGLGLAPLIFFTASIHTKLMKGFSEWQEEQYKKSGGFITDSLTNIRTVISFGNDDLILRQYYKFVEEPIKSFAKKSHVNGLLMGLSNFFILITYGINFLAGALFIKYYDISLENMMIAMFGIIFAAFQSGQTQQFAPDIGKSLVAAEELFKIIESQDEQDLHKDQLGVRLNDNIKVLSDASQQSLNEFLQQLKGDIEFQNVYFKYPSREKQLFDNLSFKIKSGQKVALVGASGCGKSTIMKLLLRFYEIDKGNILIDGKNIKSIDPSQLRSLFGVVQQEPVLFNQTIEFNIRYNSGEDITFDDIQKAAEQVQQQKIANALQFIKENAFEFSPQKNGSPSTDVDVKQEDLGQGFQRKVGTKGSQISGGQKQRIAIARSFLKNPKILILDEATSALDSKSEEVVQKSLQKIMESKTAMIIAHKIATIKDCDNIFVFKNGQIIEEGNYDQLVSKHGEFYKLEQGINEENVNVKQDIK